MIESGKHGSDRPARRTGIVMYSLAGVLLILAARWAAATTVLRMVGLWVIALAVFGRWGRQRLGDGHRAVLAGLIGVGGAHLVLFPTAGLSGQETGVKFSFVILTVYGLAALHRRLKASDIPPAQDGTDKALVRVLTSHAVLWISVAGPVMCGVLTLMTDPTPLLAIWAPLAYFAIFVRLAYDYRVTARQRPVVSLFRAAPPAVAAVIVFQIVLLVLAERRALDAERQSGTQLGGLVYKALGEIETAMAVNDRLRLRDVEDRLLLKHARILSRVERQEDALEAMLRRQRNRSWAPQEPLSRSLWDAYLTTAPLDRQIIALSHPLYLWRLDELPLPQDPQERLFLLELFAANGLFDRLLVEYMQGRLTELLATSDAGSLREILHLYAKGVLRWRTNRGANWSSEIWAAYFEGSFSRVLKAWPDYHNALVGQYRLAKRRPAEYPAPAPPAYGRIENAQMLGNHQWGLNVDDALWTALEMLPGRYAFHFEVAGKPAANEWPVLSVHLDDALLLEEPVRSETFTTVTCAAEFDTEGCHRLVIGFSNDIYKQLGGTTLNRNLYLRRMTIERQGAVSP